MHQIVFVPWHRSANYICLCLFLSSLFCTINLCICICSFASTTKSWLLQLLVKVLKSGSMTPPSLRFFNVVLVILCQYLQNSLLGFWIELHWVYKVRKNWHFYNIESTIYGYRMYLFIFIFFDFFSQSFLVFYIQTYRSWTSFFWFICKGFICFYYGAIIVFFLVSTDYYWFIGKQLVFVY